MKKLILIVLTGLSLTGCSPEFWTALEATSPTTTQCSSYDPVRNTVHYYRCAPYYPYGYYYYSYPTTYVYRYNPPIIIINNKNKADKSTSKPKNVYKDTGSRRTTGVDRSTTTPSPRPTHTEHSNNSSRKPTRGDIKSNQQ